MLWSNLLPKLHKLLLDDGKALMSRIELWELEFSPIQLPINQIQDRHMFKRLTHSFSPSDRKLLLDDGKALMSRIELWELEFSPIQLPINQIQDRHMFKRLTHSFSP